MTRSNSAAIGLISVRWSDIVLRPAESASCAAKPEDPAMMPLDVSSAPPQTTPHETRLADYQPPAFLVETVDLAFDLDEAATRVRSRLVVRRNPAAADADAPLSLDGEALTLVRIALEWRGTRRQSVPPRGRQTADSRHAGRRHAGDRDAHRAEGQHGTLRPVHLERQLLHPVRGRGLPPHHLLPRPARRDGALHHDHHRRPGTRAGHAVERQPWQRRRTPATAAIA